MLVPTFAVPQKTQLPSPLHHTNPNTTKLATPTPHIVHLINQPRSEPYSIVVVLFSWVVLHVPNKSYNLVKSIDRSMVRVTCLSPMKSYSYCSSLLLALAILDSSSFKQRSFYSKQTPSKHTKQTKSTTTNNTPKQKKGLKEHTER